MSAHVERVTVKFGLAPDGSGVFAGYPAVTAARSGAILPFDGTLWNAGIIPGRPIGNSICRFDLAAKQFKVPTRHRGDGPVTAISIAPDSPLDACNLVIGSPTDQNVHRIGVGAPFVGVLDETQDMYAVPCHLMPLLTRPKAVDAAGNQSAKSSQTTLFYDVQYNNDDANGSLLVPLRLNLYRGLYPGAMQRRARYDASVNFEVVDLGAGLMSQPSLIVLTCGRRRVHVEGLISSHAANAGSMRVDALVPRKTTSDNAVIGGDQLDGSSWINMFPATALAADETSPTVFDYAGNPFHAFAVTLTGGTLGTRGEFNLTAYDD